jgi:serine/threonine protein kinase
VGLVIGTRLGAYEVVSLLGAGGMGEVYRATDTLLKRQVALKVLPPEVANDPDRVARFQRELKSSPHSIIQTSLTCTASSSRRFNLLDSGKRNPALPKRRHQSKTNIIKSQSVGAFRMWRCPR